MAGRRAPSRAVAPVPRAVRRIFLLWTLLVLVPMGGCAEAPPPAVPDAEVPSRQEVFESARRSRPASGAAIAAIMAYHEKVCAPRQGFSSAEEPKGRRGCRLIDPTDEVRMLERMLAVTPATSPDRPRIVERIIAVWVDVDRLVNRQCANFALPADAKVGDIEDAQRALFIGDTLRKRALAEPLRLCGELRAQHPSYRPRVACPDADAAATAPSAPEWF